jgi:hypothetical protein
MDFSKWRPEILHEMKYFFGKKNIFRNSCFPPDQFSLLMNRCLLPSSATVKMDNGENIKKCSLCNEWWNCWLHIYQMKNRNTSRKTEYDLKLIKHYFASIGEIRKHNITLWYDIFHYCHWQYCIILIYAISSYGFWKRSTLTNIKKDALKDIW